MPLSFHTLLCNRTGIYGSIPHQDSLLYISVRVMKEGILFMNRIYRVIYSKAKKAYVVVSELAHTTSRNHHPGTTPKLAASLAVFSLLCGSSFAADLNIGPNQTVTTTQPLLSLMSNDTINVTTNSSLTLTGVFDPLHPNSLFSLAMGSGMSGIVSNNSTLTTEHGLLMDKNSQFILSGSTLNVGKQFALSNTANFNARLNATEEDAGLRNHINIKSYFSMQGNSLANLYFTNLSADFLVQKENAQHIFGGNGLPLQESQETYTNASATNTISGHSLLEVDSGKQTFAGNLSVNEFGNNFLENGADQTVNGTFQLQDKAQNSIFTNASQHLNNGFSINANNYIGSTGVQYLKATATANTIGVNGTNEVAPGGTQTIDGDYVMEGVQKISGTQTVNGQQTVNGNAITTGTQTASSYLVGNNTFIDNTGLHGNGYRIQNVATPVENTDAANKQYVDTKVSSLIDPSGNQTIDGNSHIQGNQQIENNLTVNGTTTLKGTAEVDGKSHFKDDVTMDKNLAVGGAVSVAGKTYISGTGLDANNQTIQNVAGPTNDTDAANKQYVDSKVGNINTDKDGNTTVEKNQTVKGDSTINGNQTVNQNFTVDGTTNLQDTTINKTLSVAGTSHFKDDVTMDKNLAVGGAVSVAGKTYISGTGINANGQTITNIKAGSLADDSTDAVNGSQLARTNWMVKTNTQLIGNGALTNGATNLTAGVNENYRLLTAITGTDGSLAQLSNRLTDLTNRHNELDLFAVKFAKNSDGSVNKGLLTLGYTDAKGQTQGTVIQNVAAGTNATDAANKGQVDAVEQGYKTADKTLSDRIDALTGKGGTVDQLQKDLGDTDKIADNIKNKDDKGNPTDTSVVDGLNNLNTKVDGLSGRVDTLENKVDTAVKDAGKHSSVTAGNGITVTEGMNANGGKEYQVSLNAENTTFGDDKNHVTIEGNKGSISATGTISAGKTSISDDGVKVGDKTYISDQGLNANGQKITNVNAGTDTTDAVNYGQLQDVQSQVTQQGNSLQTLAQHLGQVDQTAKKGIAGAAALAALHPLDYDPDNKFDVAVGVGSFKGQSATALGAFYRPNENVMFNLGGTFGNGDNAWNAGVSIKIGAGSGDTNTSKTAMVRTIKAQGQALEQQQQQIQAMAAQIDQLLKVQKEKDKKGDTSETPLQMQLAK